MQDELIRLLVGKPLRSVARREYDWVFTFADDVAVVCPCLWRIIERGRIVLTSNDHGQQFGLPAPIDGAEEGKKRLAEKRITVVSIRRETGDLAITFSEETVLEILTDSAGYEGWEFSAPGLQVVVIGGGELRVWS